MRATITSAAVALALLSGLATAQTRDHHACYKVKDSAPSASFSVTVTNAGVTQSCKVQTPAKLGCLESALSGFNPSPPGATVSANAAGNVLCYRLKCPKAFPPDAQMSDALGGSRTVSFRAARFVCAPATQGPTTGGQPATTTTTLAQQEACHFDDNDRQCKGSCASGGHCSATTSGGSCECRDTPCGNADTPSCNGFCNDPDQVCSFVPLNDCSCIRIP